MEEIKHECGVAMIRLLKPLDYYKKKYGTYCYGLGKLYLMMEKEHNRGQEGAGAGCVCMDSEPGKEYVWRERAEGADAIQKVFGAVNAQMQEGRDEGLTDDDLPWIGQVYMGHLRYSTTGRSGLSYVHPFLRRNNWRSRNLLICANFNLTNTDEIFEQVTETGQHPRLLADTFLLLEQLGHGLDRENERLWQMHHGAGLRGLELSEAIARDLNTANVLRRCAPTWDGGYVVCGIVGNGDMWALRDPNGIRPGFWYADEEVAVVASERPVIQTAFNLEADRVRELQRGEALIVDRDGTWRLEQILPAQRETQCSFERIYFSRGGDRDIYRERKELGSELVKPVLAAVDHDFDHTVFSFIPNTAEVAFYGLTEGLEKELNHEKVKALYDLRHGSCTDADVKKILERTVRRDKIAWKDVKLRTFIAEGNTRNDLAAHVYDITYGSVNPDDNLVVIDDSIVRGTTLRQSILKILDRLGPKRIVVVSSSPQVRYPDCYGIDMSRMGEFIAFRAAIELLRERGQWQLIADVYKHCKAQEKLPRQEVKNYVKEIYAPFTPEEISDKIAQMLTPEGTRAEVKIVYQTLEGMYRAIPRHRGDWYFSGDYPTPGGNRVVNRAFINFYEGNPLKRD